MAKQRNLQELFSAAVQVGTKEFTVKAGRNDRGTVISIIETNHGYRNTVMIPLEDVPDIRVLIEQAEDAARETATLDPSGTSPLPEEPPTGSASTL